VAVSRLATKASPCSRTRSILAADCGRGKTSHNLSHTPRRQVLYRGAGAHCPFFWLFFLPCRIWHFPATTPGPEAVRGQSYRHISHRPETSPSRRWMGIMYVKRAASKRPMDSRSSTATTAPCRRKPLLPLRLHCPPAYDPGSDYRFGTFGQLRCLLHLLRLWSSVCSLG
jgi:hypothetical protein